MSAATRIWQPFQHRNAFAPIEGVRARENTRLPESRSTRSVLARPTREADLVHRVRTEAQPMSQRRRSPGVAVFTKESDDVDRRIEGWKRLEILQSPVATSDHQSGRDLF